MDLPQVQVVETKLAAGQGQDQGIHGCALDKLRVIISARMRPVAAAHQEDVLDRSAFDGGQNGWSLAENGISGKAGGQHVAAVQPAPALVGLITTQGKGLLDEGCKILVPVLVRRDMGDALVAHDGGRRSWGGAA